ncbi:MAG: ArnT family glycosyltransferase [Anaerolineae bacterium]
MKRFFHLIFIFLLALIPKLVALDAFLTPDEYLWVSRAARFCAAFLEGDWGGTRLTGHPGVMTMWLGASGLVLKYLWCGEGCGEMPAFLRAVPTFPLDLSFIPFVRAPVAVAMALFAPAFYILTSKLFEARIALVSTILLTFDPFPLALSRVLHHDALESAFMTLALLSLMVALGRGREAEARPSWYVVLSGLAGGLAFLTKSSAWVFFPFAIMLTLITWKTSQDSAERGSIRPWRTLLLWWAVAAGTFCFLWPAMWVSPLNAMKKVLATGAFYSIMPHEVGSFFLGRFVHDPGAFFYPLSLFLRLTPLACVGSVAALLYLSRPGDKAREKSNILTLLAYIFLFMVAMALGSKKQERYLLPIFPPVSIVAGFGLCQAARAWRRILPPAMSLTMLLAIQAALTLSHHPYYLTFYNPLSGGGRLAPQTVLVGWGEGLDEAARYLNAKEGSAKLRAASWYFSVFSPFFAGEARLFPVEPAKNEGDEADYLIIYINQKQRQEAYPWLAEFLQAYRLEHVVRLKGIDYAWVYCKEALPLSPAGG